MPYGDRFYNTLLLSKLSQFTNVLQFSCCLAWGEKKNALGSDRGLVTVDEQNSVLNGNLCFRIILNSWRVLKLSYYDRHSNLTLVRVVSSVCLVVCVVCAIACPAAFSSLFDFFLFYPK